MLSHGCSCGKASQIIFFVSLGLALAMSAAQGAGRDGPIQVLSDGVCVCVCVYASLDAAVLKYVIV